MWSAKYILSLSVVFTVLLLSAVSIEAQEANSTEDFTVHEAMGPRSFTLSRAKGSYVALHFLLKTVCPLCMRHTHEYAIREHEVPGIYHVFLKPDSDEEIESWAVKLDERYPELADDARWKPPVIYRDPEAQLAKQYNIPFGYEFHNQVVHYPALIILGPDGRELFRYVGKNNGDRYSFDQFKDKMNELKNK